MSKKLLLLIMVFAFMVVYAGCGGKENPGGDTPDQTPDIPTVKDKMQVVDRDGVRLGEIDSRANCTAADAGIFYSIFELAEYKPTADAEYRFFNKEDHTDVLLGTFENQGYEAYYTRTELDGRIYTLAVQGTVSAENVPLVLLAFDPAKRTMKAFTVSENGFPYADMTAVNGKLLIMNHEMAGIKEDRIYEFNPADETIRQVLSFSSDTDSLRGICAAEEGFYVLRLKINNGGENEMFVDLYDKEYGKKSEQSVNEAMIRALENGPGVTGRQDALNELGMYVLQFTVEDGRYMFYENFSVSRVILDLETGEALLSQDDMYSVSTGNGKPVLYRMDFDPDNVEAPEITGVENGKLVNYPFKPMDSHKLVRTVSRSNAGTWLVMTSDDAKAFSWTLAIHLWTE